MDARFPACCAALAISLSLGAGYRTQNFIIMAPTPELSREIGDEAESLRRSLAIDWLGAELPAWRDPCPIHAQVSPKLGAGGVTRFMFERRQPFNWTMSIQGNRERVLDSVLPHEITHTIFATHFGQPLPRWADEGACTTVEHASERQKHDRFLIQFLKSDRGIPFNQLFAMEQYPADILPLYSQGYSLAKYLIAQGGRQKYVQFVETGLKTRNWPAATQTHYEFANLSDLQVKWLDWVRQGSPLIAKANPSPIPKLVSVEPASAPIAIRPSPDQNAFAKRQPKRDSMPAPEVQLASATNNESGSWYLRQRDKTHIDRQNSQTGPRTEPTDKTRRPPEPVVRTSNNSRFRNPQRGLSSEPAEPEQTMTRPQQPEGPRQIILEWSKDPDSASGNPPLRVMPDQPKWR